MQSCVGCVGPLYQNYRCHAGGGHLPCTELLNTILSSILNVPPCKIISFTLNKRTKTRVKQHQACVCSTKIMPFIDFLPKINTRSPFGTTLKMPCKEKKENATQRRRPRSSSVGRSGAERRASGEHETAEQRQRLRDVPGARSWDVLGRKVSSMDPLCFFTAAF